MSAGRWAERVQAVRQYRWSSYAAYVEREKPPAWLVCEEFLKRVGGRRAGWQNRYQEYVEGALREGILGPWEQLHGQVILGERPFIEGLKGELGGDRRGQPSLRQLEARPAWPEIVKAVGEAGKVGTVPGPMGRPRGGTRRSTSMEA